ncbi:MAG: sulfite exporter TauE/SafE family protein [Hyphomicrobiaceae bacterium]
MTELGLDHIATAVAATLLISFVKGAFGGGFGLVGIPLMSLSMDPITAGAIVAPLFIPMDIVALRYYPPKTWSWPDLKVLLPALIIGIGFGYLALETLDPRIVSILIAVVALYFAYFWYAGGQIVKTMPRSNWLAALAGTASGVTTMVAHSGAPPLAVYLLRLGLAKEVYVGTNTIYFACGNIVKVWPWLIVGNLPVAAWTLIAICVPVAAAGVAIGWRLHRHLDQRQLYSACYGLLALASLKLLWDGIRGFL